MRLLIVAVNDCNKWPSGADFVAELVAHANWLRSERLRGIDGVRLRVREEDAKVEASEAAVSFALFSQPIQRVSRSCRTSLKSFLALVGRRSNYLLRKASELARRERPKRAP